MDAGGLGASLHHVAEKKSGNELEFPTLPSSGHEKTAERPSATTFIIGPPTWEPGHPPGDVNFALSGFVGILELEHGADFVNGVDGGVDHRPSVSSRETKASARLDNGRGRKTHHHHA